ncbi:Protein cbp-1 [Trichinella pseudospiralis]|uniref:histone acetyltransferase n=1 Tax=Trichinella pseudospiralis TaxID=6337 RepID=A0A0V1FPN8_TRIPS|nr:Protein cbp-1 [Trichinella pseudospiralis]KRY88008.1 Protein cbp-1 [Trichinella pseudospiralis]
MSGIPVILIDTIDALRLGLLNNYNKDFDLCQSCYEKSKHEHKMEQMKSINRHVDSNSGEPEAMSTNSRNESIKRCVQSLEHASQCRDANCQRLSCHKLKRVVQHANLCEKRQAGHCPVCKQLVALSCHHARTCVEHNCLVPLCHAIRKKLNDEMNKKMHSQSSSAANGPMKRDHYQANGNGQGSLTVAASSVISTTVQGRKKVNTVTQRYPEQISGQMTELAINARTVFMMTTWTVEARRRSSFLNQGSSQNDPAASSQSGDGGMINVTKKRK